MPGAYDYNQLIINLKKKDIPDFPSYRYIGVTLS